MNHRPPFADRAVARVPFLQIYFAFAAGYLLSYLFRTVNAVISPELVRELALNPSSLGLLTSSYLLAFAAMQIPVAIWWRVPDMPKPLHTAGLGAQFAGVRKVFGHPRFWWIAPLGGFGMGSFMAIQGLWAVPWLMDVDGGTRAMAANHLLAMNAVIMFGYVALGLFGTRLARRGIHPRHLFGAGFAVNTCALLMIVLGAPGSYLWWTLYGLGAAVNVLGFTVLGEGFGRELAGRASTALNLLMFIGSFAAQWGIGVIVDGARTAFALDTASGLRTGFAAILVGNFLTYGWFVRGWRRHGARPVPAAA